jgi:hypothetical protein
MTSKPKTGKHPGGRPPHVPTDATRQTVSLHATVGTRQEVIAEILGISTDSLQRHYRSELDTSREKANASVGGALFKKAMSGDTASMIFWMKTRARWKETFDVSNDDGSLNPNASHAAVLAALAKIHDAGSDRS